jgi:hypothetical protein
MVVAGFLCAKEMIMVSSDLLENAACRGMGEIFDVDSHHHDILTKYNSCWMCEEASTVCDTCPVFRACWIRAVETRESYMICAGRMWSSGRAKPLHFAKRRRPGLTE